MKEHVERVLGEMQPSVHPKESVDLASSAAVSESHLSIHGKTVNVIGQVKGDTHIDQRRYTKTVYNIVPFVPAFSVTKSDGEILTTLKGIYTPYRMIRRLFDDSGLEIEETFINLSIVKKEKQVETEKKSLEKHLSCFDTDFIREEISIKEIFDQKETQQPIRRILIEGRAGIGKTTLSQFIAYLWSVPEEKRREKLGDWPNQFNLVIWIPLVRLTTLSNLTIGHFIVKEYLNGRGEISADDIDHFLKGYQGKILYLLDGYDEVIGKEGILPFIHHLLHQDYWILTSRPNSAPAEARRACRQLENIGFKKEQKEEFIRKYLKETGRVENITPLLEYLEANDSASSISYLPINLELICRYWKPGLGDQSITTSQLYEKIIVGIFSRFFRDKQKQEDFASLKEIFDDSEAATYLAFYMELAVKGAERNRLLFDEAFYKEMIPRKGRVKFTENALIKLGMLKTAGASDAYPECYFLHPSFQDFFTALHFSHPLTQGKFPPHYSSLDDFITKKMKDEKFHRVFWMMIGSLYDYTDLLNQIFTCMNQKSTDLPSIILTCRSLEEAPLQDISTKSEILKKLIQFMKNKPLECTSSSLLRECHRIFAESEIQEVIQGLPIETVKFLMRTGIEKNQSQYKLLADNGDAHAQYLLGLFYTFGSAQDVHIAFKYLIQAEKSGNSLACFLLGSMYYIGVPQGKDLKKAAEFLKKAASCRHVSAQFVLGFMYEKGDGVPENKEEACRWYRLAADQGNSRAQFSLGWMYAEGTGIAQNLEEACRWYRLAADQGDARAQVNLGFMYEKGNGVPENKEEACRWYRLAADQGNSCAQVNLGLMYEKGDGVPENKEEAYRWYRLAADQGDARAQVNLGFMYEKGNGVPENKEEACRWYRLAADQGDASAQVNLGFMYEKGNGVPENKEEACRWYRLAADQGNSRAQVNLGLMYMRGDGIPQNKKEAYRWCRLAADQGDARAQVNLGFMYEKGNGVPENKEEACRWYRLAADQGNSRAQFSLGWMYAEGTGIAQNLEEAFRWYRLAADQGDARAQVNLGFMYEKGNGVPENKEEACRWYRLAADQGNSCAQVNLGLMYMRGDGISENKEEACRWYRLAADQGDARAQFNLGLMYTRGDGISENKEEACRWYRLAADQGDAQAQFFLGRMYAEGTGIAQDLEEAYRWYRLAADQGYADAKRYFSSTD